MSNSCIKQTVGPLYISAKQNFVSSLNLAKHLLDKHRVLDSPVTISVIHDVIKIVFSQESTCMRQFYIPFLQAFYSFILLFVLSICLGYSFTLTKQVTSLLLLGVSAPFLRTEKAIYSLIISDINIPSECHTGLKRERRTSQIHSWENSFDIMISHPKKEK